MYVKYIRDYPVSPAPLRARPRARRKKKKVRWTFFPPSGFAIDGEPWAFERSRIA